MLWNTRCGTRWTRRNLARISFKSGRQHRGDELRKRGLQAPRLRPPSTSPPPHEVFQHAGSAMARCKSRSAVASARSAAKSSVKQLARVEKRIRAARSFRMVPGSLTYSASAGRLGEWAYWPRPSSFSIASSCLGRAPRWEANHAVAFLAMLPRFSASSSSSFRRRAASPASLARVEAPASHRPRAMSRGSCSCPAP